jgi:hypothetical protein
MRSYSGSVVFTCTWSRLSLSRWSTCKEPRTLTNNIDGYVALLLRRGEDLQVETGLVPRSYVSMGTATIAWKNVRTSSLYTRGVVLQAHRSFFIQVQCIHMHRPTPYGTLASISYAAVELIDRSLP